MFDAHIHSSYGKSDTPQDFLTKAKSAGITGGNIFSVDPERYMGCPEGDYRWEARLDAIFAFTSQTPGFYPYFWIDPTNTDIEKQIHTAVDRGIHGFKIICNKYYPEDCIPACEMIAETGKPVMFHSGVLGGKRDQLSMKYNMPYQFECLFAVKGLRFSMAHLGWPWVDDYMAMVAKAAFTNDKEFKNRLYFDLTPGTPGIYRKIALRKLYLTAYRVKNYVLWGTDGSVNNYDTRLPLYWLERDQKIMKEIPLDAEWPRQPYSAEAPDFSDIFDLAVNENWKTFAKGE